MQWKVPSSSSPGAVYGKRPRVLPGRRTHQKQQPRPQQHYKSSSSSSNSVLENGSGSGALLQHHQQQQKPLPQEYLPDQIYWNNGLGGGNSTADITTTPAASESAANFEQDWASVGLDFAVGRNVDADIDIDLLLADDTGRQFDVFQQPSLSPEEEASLIQDLQHSDFSLFENTPVPSLNAQPSVTMENNQDANLSDLLLTNASTEASNNPFPSYDIPMPSAQETTPSSSHSPPLSQRSSQAGSSRSSSSVRSRALEDDAETKRKRNTMAARRYRQRKLDRVAELEKQLAEMTSERDDLKVKLARREAEVGALREVINARR